PSSCGPLPSRTRSPTQQRWRGSTPAISTSGARGWAGESPRRNERCKPNTRSSSPSGRTRSRKLIPSSKPLDYGRDSVALEELDERDERAIHGRRHAERLAFAHDEAVQMIDLGRLAAREILCRGGKLAGHRAGDAAH